MRKTVITLLLGVALMTSLASIGVVGAQQPQLTVESQATNGNTINVSHVSIDQHGFIVIHPIVNASEPAKYRENEADTEEILGADYVQNDTNGTYLVGLNEDKSLEKPNDIEDNQHHLIAMLYYDTNGDQEFDIADDNPVMMDNSSVRDYFVASVGQGSRFSDFAKNIEQNQTQYWDYLETQEELEELNETNRELKNETQQKEQNLSNVTEEGGSPLPGFTGIIAILSLIAVAGFAIRRR